jgi:hypothetical protein
MTFHKGSIVCCLIRLRCEYRPAKTAFAAAAR